MVDSSDAMTFDAKIGNPWSILPIKNKKYAQDLVEVHLSDRDLNSLEKFEQFPNLEVIWLNNNRVSTGKLLTLPPNVSVTKSERHRNEFSRERSLLPKQPTFKHRGITAVQVPSGPADREQLTT